MVIPGRVLRHGHQIDRSIRSTAPVNHRSGGHTDDWSNLIAAAVIGGRFPRRKHANLLVERAVVGIEGVNAVVLGRDIKDVASTGPEEIDIAGKKGLRVDLAVDGEI